MEITRSAKKGVARAEKLEKLAKGIPTGAKKDKAVKAIGKKFYKQVRDGEPPGRVLCDCCDVVLTGLFRQAGSGCPTFQTEHG